MRRTPAIACQRRAVEAREQAARRSRSRRRVADAAAASTGVGASGSFTGSCAVDRARTPCGRPPRSRAGPRRAAPSRARRARTTVQPSRARRNGGAVARRAATHPACRRAPRRRPAPATPPALRAQSTRRGRRARRPGRPGRSRSPARVIVGRRRDRGELRIGRRARAARADRERGERRTTTAGAGGARADAGAMPLPAAGRSSAAAAHLSNSHFSRSSSVVRLHRALDRFLLEPPRQRRTSPSSRERPRSSMSMQPGCMLSSALRQSSGVGLSHAASSDQCEQEHGVS